MVKKIDLQLDEKDNKKIMDFFNNKNKFDKFNINLTIDKYPFVISFYESSFNLSVLNISIKDVTSDKIYYFKASNIYELKYINLKISDKHLSKTFLLNIKNIKRPELINITDCCTNDEDMDIVEYMFNTINFGNTSELTKFCIVLYNKDCINFEKLSQADIEVILSKLSYYGYEQLSNDLYYYQKILKKTFFKSEFKIKNLCSFIIYCLKYLYRYDDIEPIRDLIPKIEE